jgi:hypothetical protein
MYQDSWAYERLTPDNAAARLTSVCLGLVRLNLAIDGLPFDRGPDAPRYVLPGEVGNFYMIIDQDAGDAHLAVVDGARAVRALQHVTQTNEHISAGLTALLTNFINPLADRLRMQYPRPVNFLLGLPQPSGVHPPYERFTEPDDEDGDRPRILYATLTHGQAIADQCERLGADPKAAGQLRLLADIEAENMLLPWAVARGFGIFGEPDGSIPAYRLWTTHEEWYNLWRFMFGARKIHEPGQVFYPAVYSAMVTNVADLLTESAVDAGSPYSSDVLTALPSDERELHLMTLATRPANHRLRFLLDIRAQLAAYAPPEHTKQ